MSRRFTIIGLTAVLAALCTLVPPPSYAYDFSLGLSCPAHVVKGHSIYLWIEAELLEGDRDYVFYHVFGLLKCNFEN
jgi:hypothetical protein